MKYPNPYRTPPVVDLSLELHPRTHIVMSEFPSQRQREILSNLLWKSLNAIQSPLTQKKELYLSRDEGCSWGCSKEQTSCFLCNSNLKKKKYYSGKAFLLSGLHHNRTLIINIGITTQKHSTHTHSVLKCHIFESLQNYKCWRNFQDFFF